MKGRRISLKVLVAMWGAALAACPTLADSIEIVSDPWASTEGLGSFAGTLDYQAEAFSTAGILTVMLTNTSDAANGGFITGFLFNIGGGVEDATASLLDSPEQIHPFTQCLGRGLNGKPFGKPFDAGAALGGKFAGGGKPTEGIAVGETGVFAFEIAADDAGSLSALDFLEGGSFEHNFIVRFRGFADGGSDKVAGMIVPLPTPLLLGAAGLAGVMVIRRRSAR